MRNNNRITPLRADRLVLAWASAAAIVLALVSPVSANSIDLRVIPPVGNLYGRLGAAWWQWALSFPPDRNPIDDPTGAVGQDKQNGPVWFLAGNHGGTTERTLTVPLGKPLFFPVINQLWVTTCVGEPRNRDGIRPLITPPIDAATGLAVEIDGKPVRHLNRYRAESPLFCTPMNLFGVDDPGDLAAFCPGGTSEPDCTEGVNPREHWGTDEGFGPSMTDGYWILLAPLSQGAHTIRFTATSGDFSLDVTYQLNVVRPSHILSPNTKLFGKSYGEWAGKWWQWVFSIPADRNPLTDATGEFADEQQSGPVWFVAGTFGNSAERSFTVPRGKFLFMPVFNWIFGSGVFDCDPTVPGVPCVVDDLRAGAAQNTEAAEVLEVSIDGLPVPDVRHYRASSPAPFSITYPENSVTGVPAGTYHPQVTDGYWLMLAPLSRGEHEIRMHVRAPDTLFGLIEYTVVHHITAE